MPSPVYVTLTANVVSTVDVTDVVPTNGGTVKVITDDNSTAPVYFSVDGSTPTVGGSGDFVVLGGGRNYETASINRSHNATTGVDGTALVKLISAAAAWVEVQAGSSR